MQNSLCTILLTLIIGIGLTVPVQAQQQQQLQTLQRPIVLQHTPLKISTEKRTRFNPQQHGFKFANTFTNDFIRELDVRTGGLCGGMVYAALDYFHNARAVPQQTHRPAVQTELHDYIYDRQVKSLETNLDKWIEVGFNPLGARDSEFFNWGLQGSGGGRLQELRRYIDGGNPVPLGLQSYGDGGPGNHQVLAIGYDMGRYRGDLGAYKEDFKILVYDPNYVNQVLTLVPDLRRKAYVYREKPDKFWRTYFVDAQYRAQRPPNVSNPATGTSAGIRELLLEIGTGGDDLRGGNDNVHVIVHFDGRGPQRVNNVNRGRRWIDNYTQTVRIPFSRPVLIESIRAVELLTNFGGGLSGENWNVNALRVMANLPNGQRVLFDQSGAPLVRLTGERKNYIARIR